MTANTNGQTIIDILFTKLVQKLNVVRKTSAR